MTTYFNMNIPILEQSLFWNIKSIVPVLEHKINRPVLEQSLFWNIKSIVPVLEQILYIFIRII